MSTNVTILTFCVLELTSDLSLLKVKSGGSSYKSLVVKVTSFRLKFWSDITNNPLRWSVFDSRINGT